MKILLACHHRPEWTIWLGKWQSGKLARIAVAIFENDIYWAFPADEGSKRCPVADAKLGDLIVYDYTKGGVFHAFRMIGDEFQCIDSDDAYPHMTMDVFILFIVSLRPRGESHILFVQDKLSSQFAL